MDENLDDSDEMIQMIGAFFNFEDQRTFPPVTHLKLLGLATDFLASCNKRVFASSVRM